MLFRSSQGGTRRTGRRKLKMRTRSGRLCLNFSWTACASSAGSHPCLHSSTVSELTKFALIKWRSWLCQARATGCKPWGAQSRRCGGRRRPNVSNAERARDRRTSTPWPRRCWAGVTWFGGHRGFFGGCEVCVSWQGCTGVQCQEMSPVVWRLRLCGVRSQ